MKKQHGSEKRYMPRQIAVRMSDTMLEALREDAAARDCTVAQAVRHHLRAALGVKQ